MTEKLDKTNQRRTVNFAHRLRARSPLAGLFIRSSDHKQIEVLGRSHLDLICLDAEHAVFDRADLDRCVLAARETDIPCLIRTPKLDSRDISQALDIGAVGVLVPHIQSTADARMLARLSRYGCNGRGFASSCRSAGYGMLDRADNIAKAVTEICVIGMLEDPEAFDDLDSIVSTPGIDGFFIGKSDLSVAMGVATNSKELILKLEQACVVANKYKKALGMVLESPDLAPHWIELGMSFFLISSDYSLILQGARTIQQGFVTAVRQTKVK